jgi:uncharacterized membrane protein YGL010W
MSTTLKAHFADYSAYHATAGNQACHYLAVPVIVLTVLALLAQVPLFAVGGVMLTLAEVVLVATVAWYLTLDRPLALGMLVFSVGCVVAGRFMPAWLSLTLFVASWVVQFIGHYVYEKKSPAFFQNVTHLLVGPLWVLAKATGRS